MSKTVVGLALDSAAFSLPESRLIAAGCTPTETDFSKFERQGCTYSLFRHCWNRVSSCNNLFSTDAIYAIDPTISAVLA